MRTTIRLNDDLLAQAKVVAARSGRTLTAVIEDALRQFLARGKKPTARPVTKLKTAGRGGLRPGVSLDSTAELLDIMEGSDAAR
jgi:predicted transcriptional regulator